MKIKVKGVFKDKVEPTQLCELNGKSEDNLKKLEDILMESASRIIDDNDDLSGIFISREG